MGWHRTGARAAALGLALAVLSGCGGDGSSPLGKGDIPPEPVGEPTPVDVCNLLPGIVASQVLERPVRITGIEYGPARVPTLRCLLGDEFGVAVVRAELAIGPISENVFNSAYGDRAGGDPVVVRTFGLRDVDLEIDKDQIFGYLRNEQDQLSIHVYVGGSIISLDVRADPAQPVKRPQLITLASSMIAKLPPNPQLAPTSAGPLCAHVSSDAVGAAIGAVPTLAAHRDDLDGSVMCSWAASPGSATVTVVRDETSVADYRRNVDDSLYRTVDGIPGTAGLEVLSRDDDAGDLTIFAGRRTMVFISVIPSAGFADAGIGTTPAESDLAASVVETLLPG